MVEKERMFKNRKEWRSWLEKYSSTEKEIWLVFYKKGSAKRSILYEEAVEEALCFGWIDSRVKKIDNEKFKQKYTPRKDRSAWSQSNKKRVEKLIQKGLMTEAGLERIETAKRNRSWEKLDDIEKTAKMPEDLLDALRQDERAKENFEKFTPSQKKQYLWWLKSARREETRKKRIVEIVRRAAKNIKPGI